MKTKTARITYYHVYGTRDSWLTRIDYRGNRVWQSEFDTGRNAQWIAAKAKCAKLGFTHYVYFEKDSAADPLEIMRGKL
jgi:hypothetical protein